MTVTIGTSACSVPSIYSTMRYQESQLLPAAVVNRTFTFGGVHFHECSTYLLISVVEIFFYMLNFRGWSPSWNYFNSEIFPIYGTNFLVLHHTRTTVVSVPQPPENMTTYCSLALLKDKKVGTGCLLHNRVALRPSYCTTGSCAS